MKYFAALAVASLGLGALVAFADKDADQADMAKLEGVWKVEGIWEDGKPVPPEVQEKMRLKIKGTTWTFHIGDDQVAAGTFGLNAAKKTIHRTDLEGKDKGKSYHGIYEIDGDTFKTCWSPKDQDPPTAFESKEGSGHEYEVMKRAE